MIFTEPSASTVAGVAAGTYIGLSGTILGAQPEAVVIGLMTAIPAAVFVPAVSGKLRACSAVALGAALAGYGATALAQWLAAHVGDIGTAEALRPLAAALLGAGTPTLGPVIIGRISSIIGSKQNG